MFKFGSEKKMGLKEHERRLLLHPTLQVGMYFSRSCLLPLASNTEVTLKSYYVVNHYTLFFL